MLADPKKLSSSELKDELGRLLGKAHSLRLKIADIAGPLREVYSRIEDIRKELDHRDDLGIPR